MTNSRSTHVGTPTVRQALVIEDSPATAEQITRYLTELGARVEVHPTGSGAAEHARAMQPDVIVLDLLLTDQTGWEVLRQLKAELRTRAIPVVIVSVVDEPARARTLGAAAYLVKPIDRAMLSDALRQAITKQHAPPSEQVRRTEPRLDAPRPRILLAEDNQENVEVMREYLHAQGFEVLVARNGHEALARAQETALAVIVMDIQMPGMDGLEAIRRLRADAHLRDIPIIAVTALAMQGDRERCFGAGADDYLTKPVSLHLLRKAIDTHLHHRKEHAQHDPTGDPHPSH